MMLLGIYKSIYCVNDCKRNTIYCVFRQHPRRPAVPHHEAQGLIGGWKINRSEPERSENCFNFIKNKHLAMRCLFFAISIM